MPATAFILTVRLSSVILPDTQARGIQLMNSKQRAVFAHAFVAGLMLASASPLMAQNAGVTDQKGSDIQSASIDNTRASAIESARAELLGPE